MIVLARPSPNRGVYENQWEYALSAFPPDQVVDLEAPTIAPRLVLAPRAGRYVRGVIDLADVVHPEDATYVFGPDWAHLTVEDTREGDQMVYIPTASPHEMYSWVAYAVTMWDRHLKRSRG
jgi:hypothetical protein